MKTIKIGLSVILFLLVTTISSHAQIIDSFPWFKQPGTLLTPKVMDWNAAYNLRDAQKVVSRKTSTAIAGKQVRIPKDIQFLQSTIILERGDACYQVAGNQNKNCTNCQLFWKDLNGDQKIQPHRELRSVCPKNGDSCGLRARKIDCK